MIQNSTSQHEETTFSLQSIQCNPASCLPYQTVWTIHYQLQLIEDKTEATTVNPASISADLTFFCILHKTIFIF